MKSAVKTQKPPIRLRGSKRLAKVPLKSAERASSNVRNDFTVNIHEAKTNLSKLVERVANGEQIVIAKAGKPVAKLIRYEEPLLPRKPGAWKGKVWISPDFDKPDPELEDLFYNSPIFPPE